MHRQCGFLGIRSGPLNRKSVLSLIFLFSLICFSFDTKITISIPSRLNNLLGGKMALWDYCLFCIPKCVLALIQNELSLYHSGWIISHGATGIYGPSGPLYGSLYMNKWISLVFSYSPICQCSNTTRTIYVLFSWINPHWGISVQ